MDDSNVQLDNLDPRVNPAVYFLLPPAEAQYQLDHINDSRVSETLVSHYICLMVAWITVALRFLTRRIKRTPYGVDDWLMLAGIICFTGYVSLVLLDVYDYGAARHAILLKDPITFAKVGSISLGHAQQNILRTMMSNNTQIVMAAEVLYAPSIGCIKLSTVVLYGRIFTFKGFRQFLWVLGFIIVVNCTANIFDIIFQCHPVSGAWNPVIRVTAHCVSLHKFFQGLATINVVTDFLLLVAPLPHLWHLHCPMTTKLQLMSLFSIGFL